MPITSDTLRALVAKLKAASEELDAVVAELKAEEESSARARYPEPRALTRKA